MTAAASMDFPGTSSSDISCTRAQATEGIGYLSISMYVNFDVIDPSGSNTIMQKGSGNAQTLRILNWDNGTGQLLFDTADNTDSGGVYAAIGSLSTGTWYHIVCTKDMVTATDVNVIYIDGVSQSLTLFNDQTTSFTAVNTNNLIIGSQLSASRWFNGKLAYISIYDSILSEEQVQELRFKPDSIAANRIAYWPLWDSSALDYSGNAYNGTLNGSVATITDGPPVSM